MKIILSSKRHHYLAKFSIFLVVVALVAGMAGCGGGVEHYLIISSTPGGSVTIPGEGTFTYNVSTVVSLVATPDAGYKFVKWTGNVSTIADVNAATTITMHDDYAITANFHKSSEIWDWYDLDAIRDNLGGNYTLMNDLDFNTAGYEQLAGPTANGGAGWRPIGCHSVYEGFTGTFDGQGYQICDLFIDRFNEAYVGLFGYLDDGGRIEDIGVVNATVAGYDLVGSLVGVNEGIVNNSYSTGTVTGEELVGGLLGGNGGNVTNSYSTCNVIGNAAVGGLVGYHSLGTVSDTHSTGSVTGEELVGGLVGGTEEGTVSNSYSTGSVIGDVQVGGLVGGNFYYSIVLNSYSSSSVTGNSDVGGLVGGTEESTVSNSYSTGSVIGDVQVGGLVGGNFYDSIVLNSYSSSSVTGNSDVGGLVGLNEGGPVNNSFWDTETSGQSDSDGGTGTTTAEMQDITTFTDTEAEGLDEPWNITAVANPGERNPSYTWNIVDDVTYPFLSWQS